MHHQDIWSFLLFFFVLLPQIIIISQTKRLFVIFQIFHQTFYILLPAVTSCNSKFMYVVFLRNKSHCCWFAIIHVMSLYPHKQTTDLWANQYLGNIYDERDA